MRSKQQLANHLKRIPVEYLKPWQSGCPSGSDPETDHGRVGLTG